MHSSPKLPSLHRAQARCELHPAIWRLDQPPRAPRHRRQLAPPATAGGLSPQISGAVTWGGLCFLPLRAPVRARERTSVMGSSRCTRGHGRAASNGATWIKPGVSPPYDTPEKEKAGRALVVRGPYLPKVTRTGPPQGSRRGQAFLEKCSWRQPASAERRSVSSCSKAAILASVCRPEETPQ